MKHISKNISNFNGKYNLKLKIKGCSKEELEAILKDIICDLEVKNENIKI